MTHFIGDKDRDTEPSDKSTAGEEKAVFGLIAIVFCALTWGIWSGKVDLRAGGPLDPNADTLKLVCYFDSYEHTDRAKVSVWTCGDRKVYLFEAGSQLPRNTKELNLKLLIHED